MVTLSNAPVLLGNTQPKWRAAMSRTETTMDAIERFIASNRLQPGDPLPTEAELVASLGVSRSSVREALRQLQALEIVEVQQGRGAFVGDMSMRPFIKSILLRYSISPDSIEALRQVISLRRILDHGIAYELIAQFRDTTNPELHALVDTMEERAKQGKLFTNEDIAFHRGLLSRIDNLLVEQVVAAMWEIHTTAAQSLALSPQESLIETAKAHRAILISLEEGNHNGYLEAVNQHYHPLENILDL